MNIKNLNVLIAMTASVMLLTGCGFLSTAPTPQPAQLRLTAPATGLTLKPDERVAIQGQYSGEAIAAVQLWVNGAADSVLEVRAGDPALALDWVPKTTGRQILYLEAYDQANAVVARSDAVVLMVDAPIPTAAPPTALAEPTPTVAPLPSPIAMTAAMTDVVTATNVITTAVPTAAVSAGAVPSVAVSTTGPSLTIASASVNLRGGPGTNYGLQGLLTQGQTATVVGKSADGAWWQISVAGRPVWVFGELVQANAAAAGVAVATAPPAPTAVPITEATPAVPAAPAVATAPVTPVAVIEFTAVPVVAKASATPSPTAGPTAEVCNDTHPFWAARLDSNAEYEFCTPVPFEFVPGASADADELVIRWHIFGVQSVELRIDPSGDSCGMGTTGRRQQVAFVENNFRLNRRDFPAGGYKIGLWATLNNGRVQDWGELHFCGK